MIDRKHTVNTTINVARLVSIEVNGGKQGGLNNFEHNCMTQFSCFQFRYMVLPLLKKCVLDGFSARHVVISRIYLYFYCFGALNYWRGIWDLMDLFASKHWQPSLICVCVCIVLLLACRSISQSYTTPYNVTLDNRSDFYQTSPRFRTSLVSDKETC